MWLHCMVTRLFIWGATLHAAQQRRRFHHEIEHAPRVQEKLLQELLARHAESDFGRRHRFTTIKDAQSFAGQVPIRDHEQYRPLLERVFQGEASALFAADQPITMFALSSGSTDQPKRIPVTPESLSVYRRGWNIFGIQAIRDHPSALGRCILQVVSPMSEYLSPGGLPCGAISGLLAAQQKRIVRRFYANPSLTANIKDSEARYYTIMRMAVPRDVAWIVTPSPATTLRLVRSAADHAERLLRDIRDGTLSPPGEISSIVRQKLAAQVRPNRALCSQLEVCIARDGRLLPRHYWQLSFLANWMGGTLRLYLHDFPSWFGDVPVRDIGLLATEGRISIPLADGCPEGVLDPRAAYFEFVEEHADGSDPNTVHRPHELEVGAVYRVVMTNAAGLYRYDLGDFVRVRGFRGAAPLLEFLHRGEAVASLCGEKLTEWQVLTAYERLAAKRSIAGTRFLVTPVWDNPPYYRIGVESRESMPPDFAPQFDALLSELNIEYAAKRCSRRLGQVQAGLLPIGCLNSWDESRRRARGAGHEQFKQRYLLSQPGEEFQVPGFDQKGG